MTKVGTAGTPLRQWSATDTDPTSEAEPRRLRRKLSWVPRKARARQPRKAKAEQQQQLARVTWMHKKAEHKKEGRATAMQRRPRHWLTATRSPSTPPLLIPTLDLSNQGLKEVDAPVRITVEDVWVRHMRMVLQAQSTKPRYREPGDR